MKIDKEIFQNTLKAFIDNNEPELRMVDLVDYLNLNWENSDDLKILYFYLGILDDSKLIQCLSKDNNLGFSFTSGNVISPNISTRYRLTNSGHQTYEALSNDGIWDRIKPKIMELGIETIKQIPSLAIQIVTS
ncbi:hypothetical protein [Aquimarina megaterium]|uniref:hypothetical protein n=1 Tax=Aquimarina megaterium TaxID=1443666 RepID=UPI000942BFF7|nr:hypothetical protein [Aquimarina megaterium]